MAKSNGCRQRKGTGLDKAISAPNAAMAFDGPDFTIAAEVGEAGLEKGKTGPPREPKTA